MKTSYVHILGLIGFIASGILLMIGSSVFADFRTEKITGAGLDIRVIDRYPEVGSEFEFDVTARGGSLAGIRSLEVIKDGVTLTSQEGLGATWGNTISTKGRGSESLVLSVPVEAVDDGHAIQFEVIGRYVCAMSDGAHSFKNEDHIDTVAISLPKQDLLRKVIDALIVLAVLVVWILGSLFSIRWYLRPTNLVVIDDVDISLFGIYFFFALLGHFIFSQPLVSLIGSSSDILLFGLSIFWALVPAPVYWRVHKRLFG